MRFKFKYLLVAIVIVFGLALTAEQKVLDQARKAEQEHNIPGAIENYQRVVESDEHDIDALRHLTVLDLKAGRVAQARANAQKLMTAVPESPYGYLYLGMADALTGQNDLARSFYQKALSFDPNFAEAYFNLGFLSETDGKLLEAVDYYRKAVKADATHAQAYYNMGNALAELGEIDQAIDAYRSAVENDRNFTDAFVNLSILLAQKGDYAGAIKYVDEARLLGYQAPELYLKSLEPYREKKDSSESKSKD